MASDLDLVAAWQGFVTRWEQQVNQMSAKVSQNETFSEMMNHATKLSLASQRSLEDYMEKMLRSLHLPSANQIAEISERLAAIEERLDALAAAGAAAAAAAPNPATPPPDEPRRTRRPPPAVDA